MAKDKSTLSKDERKALKVAKKEAKASKPEGVTKPEKKDKKDKKAHTQLAERALKEIQNAPTTKDDASDDEGEADEDAEADAEADTEVKAAKTNGEKARPARPIGALVPFANPLADEKVAKKVFKGVKKGLSFLFFSFQSIPVPFSFHDTSILQYPFIWGLNERC